MQLEGALGDWQADATVLARQVRAFHPWPGACFFVPKRNGVLRIHVTAAEAVGAPTHGFAPGEIIQADKHGWTIACGRGFLHVFRVVPENRKEMSSEEFLRGARLAAGMVLPVGGGQ